jgi:hypothetical protein
MEKGALTWIPGHNAQKLSSCSSVLLFENRFLIAGIVRVRIGCVNFFFRAAKAFLEQKVSAS